MGKMLYLDCSLGVSGDMVVGSLLDLGASEEGLRRALSSLPVEGFEVKVGRRRVSSLDACDFDVVLGEGNETHDHDMAYLFGAAPAEGEPHAHDHAAHDHASHHDHAAHDHASHHDHARRHDHGHRNLADVQAIIEAAELTDAARSMAIKIFSIVAAAESKAHGVPVEEVHFHEVGALDSIVDIVSAAFCLDDLSVDDVAVSSLGEGEGTVRSAHGVLPIPVPAVTHIARDAGLVLTPLHRRGEFVTPTGAAIVAAARTADSLPPGFRILRSGLGSGRRAYDPPSFVRALLVEAAGAEDDALPSVAPTCAPDLWKLECEVDDCTGEALGRLIERLYEVGVREAHFLPVYMKKNRPGHKIEILCDEGLVPVAERLVFEDTTTIGIRRCPLWRTALSREPGVVTTPLGDVRVKIVTLPTGERRAYPEHESVSAVARERDVSYQRAWRIAICACARLGQDGLKC